MAESKNIIIGIAIVALILFAINNAPKISFPNGRFPIFSSLIPSVHFAGFNFEDSDTIISGNCNFGGGQTSISGGIYSPLSMTASSSNKGASRKLKADITGIDEVIVIYEGNGNCQAQQAGYNLNAFVVGNGGGYIGTSKGSSGCGNSGSESKVFQRALWKFRNNFDGTWGFSEGLSLGDLDFVVQKAFLNGDRQYLTLEVATSSACGLGGSATALLMVYNIIWKENGFALCKADQYVIGFNGTKPVCQNVSYLKLNFEEALYQQLSDYIAAKEAYLEEKAKALNISLEELKQQLITSNEASRVKLQQQVDNLTIELQQTKKTLELVQNKDPQVIQVFRDKELLKPETVSTQSFFSTIPTPLKVIGAILGIFLVLRFL